MKKPFPRYAEDQDKRKNLTSKQIEEIQGLRSQGVLSLKAIGEIFGVCDATIMYHTKGKKYKECWNEKVRLRTKKKRKEDAEFVKAERERDLIAKKRKREISPEYREYIRLAHQNWRNTERGRARWNEYNRVRRGKQNKLGKLKKEKDGA